MRKLLAVALSLVSGPALAQSCGPDPAPPQAASAGYTCETFRWGSGDTIGEIDTTQTYAPGFKWYFGTANVNGHATNATELSVTGGGKIFTQTAGGGGGDFVLDTCAAPTASAIWTGVGQFFQHGWYVEFVGEWNATGHSGVQTGFYGHNLYWQVPFGNCTAGSDGQSHPCWEIDNPDAFAFDQLAVNWDGGSQSGQGYPTGFVSGVNTIETGTTKFGVMSTPSALTWWLNNTQNGSTGTIFNAGLTAANVYGAKMCWGMEATAPFPLTIDSVKIWQAGGVSGPSGGGNGTLLKRR